MVPAEYAHALAALEVRRPELTICTEWHQSIASTMDRAAQAAQAGAAGGLVVLAEQQTAGRGRRGRSWSSPPGSGLYFSLVVRPDPARGSTAPVAGAARSSVASPWHLITLVAGVAVRAGILATTGLAANLKWPNDLLIGRRKLAGILTEGLAVGAADQAIVVGVGVNIRAAAYPPDVATRATSIEGELGRGVDRGAVLAAILEHLSDYAMRLGRGDGAAILSEWRAAAPSARGGRVEWDTAHGVRTGVSAGLDDSGALLVQTASSVERIIAGEVRWY